MWISGGLLRSFAVHRVLYVVPEFLNVARETLHIGNLLHVQQDRVILQALVWAYAAQLASLRIRPVVEASQNPSASSSQRAAGCAIALSRISFSFRPCSASITVMPMFLTSFRKAS